MNLDLQFYWGLLLKRMPIMLALFMICAVSTSVIALKLPPTYSTSATLLVEESQIPDSMVRAAVEVDPNQQLQVIEQRLLTRANLLDIARKSNVFDDISTMTPDAIIDGMRRQTNIRRTGGRGQATLMNVSFEAGRPRIAANVVNEYTTLILRESTNFRMERAEGTLTFFQQEVERLGGDLSLQSAQIVTFKNENAGALPSGLNYRQNRQTLLQEREARLEREIAALEKQRRDMVRVFEATGRVDEPAKADLSPEEEQLEQLKLDLQQALSIYSDTNPKVVLITNRIEVLEQALKDQAVAVAEEGSADSIQSPPTMLELTLLEMNQRSESLQDELIAVSAELTKLTTSIQNTAGNAIALEALQRDFDNTQERYNEAVANLNRARVNERIEISAQGQRISVIENASVPQEPSGPNRFRLILIGILAGSGLAGSFFFALEFFNRAIRRPYELHSRFGVHPLTVIPYMESQREQMIRRSALVFAFFAVLIGVPAALWYVDTQYLPLDILANKIFDRLGLT